jgi:hypothetical protein
MNELQKVNKNLWTATELDNSFASWGISLPYPQNSSQMSPMLRLFKEISTIGMELEIYNIEKIDAESSQIISCNYADEIEKILSTSGRLYSFGVDDAIRYGLSYICSSKIRFYDLKGDIKEEFSKDISSLLLENYPVKREDSTSLFPPTMPPILICGDMIVDLEYNSRQKLSTFEISINLHSDIWFPWIKGFVEGNISHIRSFTHPILGKAYDNRELANYHTPRLNKFLKTISQLILDYGGMWEKGYDTPEYIKMFTIDGIILD